MKKIKVLLYLEENNKEIKGEDEWIIENDKNYLIGRNTEKTQITIIDTVISRVHAEITLKDNKIFIKDLNSANGTFIDSKQIPSNELKEANIGSRIKFGDSKKFLIIKETEDQSSRINENTRKEEISKENKNKGKDIKVSERNKNRKRSRSKSSKSKSKDNYISKYNSQSKEEKYNKENKIYHRKRQYSRSRSISRSKDKNYKYGRRDRVSGERKYSKNEFSKSSFNENSNKIKGDEKKDLNKRKESLNLNKEKSNLKAERKNSIKEKSIKEEKGNLEIVAQNEKNPEKIEKLNDSGIKLISVNFLEDSEKYIEEFIQIKKKFKLDKEKSSLPAITKKIDNDKNTGMSQNDNNNKEFDLEKKFQLRGLVHEKDEFISNSLRNNTKRSLDKKPFFRKTNFNMGNINYDSNHKKNFYQNENKNFKRRNGYNLSFRGRNMRANNN